ncbi:MAG: class I SAM-dependent methyltransferase [Patescibacteria group bacterium]
MAKYLTTEEIRSDQVLKDRLRTYKGPTVRNKFCSGIVFDYKRFFFGNSGDVNVLDCGTASGDFIRQLVVDVGIKNVYGLDVDDYINDENRRFLKDFKIVDLNYDKIPHGDSFFDIITAWCVLPHLENPHNFIREVHRILKKRGIFIFTLVNTDSFLSRRYFYKYGEISGFHEKNNHISIFTPAIFNKTVLKYFKLIDKKYFVNEGIFMGVKGRARRFILNLASGFGLDGKLRKRWGSKIVYVLGK